ncbi:MAG: hypothetical protein HFI06_06575 [Eubacterium sp.]|nr:hypothetical protein [Eubacterium sp.]
MVANKNISKIIAVVMVFAVALCFLAMILGTELKEALHGTSVSMRYESELFNTEKIIQIDIQMDEKDWDDMLENAIAEEYYSCDVIVNGQAFYSVAIRSKGNTSLSAIAMDDTTDRFSLKLEFDHFVEGQSCFGLDKLILNNNYADATNMKEAVVYDMYRYLDTDASLYNYAKISLNGEYWGVYLALEAVEESFLLRNYGTQDGKLYKPDSMDMGGNADRKALPEGQEPPDGQMPPQAQELPEGQMPQEVQGLRDGQMPPEAEMISESDPRAAISAERSTENGEAFDGAKKDRAGMSPGGGVSMNGNGADLNYSDQELDSYSAIWDGEVTKTNKTDHRRVVTALEKISCGTKLETYLDVDNVLRYMAVHTFSVNMDSLSGTMAHNYYLYEYNGRLNVLPWDYNLAFGGMSIGAVSSASEMINDAIDTPFLGTEFFDELLENETYRQRYHGYLQKLADTYVFGGKFDEVYGRIRSQIDELVNADPTAFYSFDEFDKGAKMFQQTVYLRAESIKGQIDGSIPSTDEGQKENASGLVDASEVDIDVMGVFHMGGRSFPQNGQDAGFSDQGREAGSDSKVDPDGMGRRPDFGRNRPDEGKTAFSDLAILNMVYFAVCFVGMLFALLCVKVYRRKKWN